MKPTEEQVIAWARETDCPVAVIYRNLDSLVYVASLAYEAGRKDENEATADEWWSCWQADMENGVKCLNERAVEQFAKAYPQINKFGDWLAAQGENND